MYKVDALSDTISYLAVYILKDISSGVVAKLSVKAVNFGQLRNESQMIFSSKTSRILQKKCFVLSLDKNSSVVHTDSLITQNRLVR